MVDDKSGTTVQALLYRGTPDNPAFWPRALRDLPFAAAIMAAATGPSGENSVYLDQLNQFLEHQSSCPTILEKFDDTFKLAAMVKTLQQERYQLHFLFGCGSDQHNQLLLRTESNVVGLLNNGEDAHELNEIALCTSTESDDGRIDPIIGVFAGGGHSGFLTRNGRLYLCGWNEAGQLGTCAVDSQRQTASGAVFPLPVLSELSGIRVKSAALGFSHTLVIEQGTGRLLAFGENRRGQVDGTVSKDYSPNVMVPVTPKFLDQECVIAVAAGLFHSAAITQSGELFTFGCGRFGQSLSSISDEGVWTARWSPGDGSRLTKVACGRRHTVALDDRGRIWSLGENKHSQLGRTVAGRQQDATPGLVIFEPNSYECFDVKCGWSHTIVLAKDSNGLVCVLGWGRNDKGQLGNGSTDNVDRPVRLFEDKGIRSVACGSESTVVVDDTDAIWSCGWNEHGNTGTGGTSDCLQLSQVTGAPITTTPGYAIEETQLAVAAGGAHLLAMRVPGHR